MAAREKMRQNTLTFAVALQQQALEIFFTTFSDFKVFSGEEKKKI